tara:strand:+ start:1640 stop:2728 length:1089 start_codon:yes stop_codon:yes gene_type:complete
MSNLNKKVAVGMSGGIDSSVAAYLLLEAGYDVEGIFMKNWEEDDTDECNSKKDYQDAQNVCNHLKIKLHLVNFSDEYWTNVFESFISDLKRGYTPNPDVFCNKEIKFKQFYNYALSLGFDLIATGHYAKRISKENMQLHIPKDKKKDQTYFLYMMQQDVLEKTLFPLEDLEKSEVKSIASNMNLGLENKKESMGICFIGKRKFSSFIDKYVKPIKGSIVDYESNKKISNHSGLSKYTIGQRKGINIGGIKDSNESPWYVIDKDIDTNTLIVSQNQSPLFYTGEIELENINIINKEFNNKNIQVRFRHGGSLRRCILNINNDKTTIMLTEEERGIAQGQSAVFYNGTECIGGGTVTSKCLRKN